MTTTSDPRLDDAILKLGTDLTLKMKGETPGVFNKAYWEGAILEWAMKDPAFKVDMFRFVDVFASLQTKDQVKQHIEEYLLKKKYPEYREYKKRVKKLIPFIY